MENRMENGNESFESKQGWIDETSEHGGSIIKFIKKYFINKFAGNRISDKKTKDYDSFTELHFSGSNINVMARIQKEEIEPKIVKVFYDGNKAAQMHVLFDSNGQGHNIDVYLSGKALEDYLNEKEEGIVE